MNIEELMSNTETGFHADLAIAKTTMQANQQGLSQREIRAAINEDWAYRTIGLAVIISCLSSFSGNIGILAVVISFWMIAVPAFIVWKRRRLRRIRDSQLAELRAVETSAES